MNKIHFRRISFVLIAMLLGLLPAAASAGARSAPRITRNKFFIVSEVNLQSHRLVMEKPSQITVVMNFNNKTVFTNKDGKKEPISKIQAGNTVFVTYERTAHGMLAVSIRSGPMTVKLLHQLYLNG